MYGAISEIPVTLFRLSVSVLAFAAKGNQGWDRAAADRDNGAAPMAIFGLGMVGRMGLYRRRHYSRFQCGSVSSEASQNSGANNTILSLLDLHRVRAAARIGCPRADEKGVQYGRLSS